MNFPKSGKEIQSMATTGHVAQSLIVSSGGYGENSPVAKGASACGCVHHFLCLDITEKVSLRVLLGLFKDAKVEQLEQLFWTRSRKSQSH